MGLKVSCPNCSKEVEWEKNPFRPFCSERCRLIDLGGWASEKYKIPAEEDTPSSEEKKEAEEENKKKK